MMVFIEKVFQRPRTMRRPPTTIFAKYYNPKTKRTTVCATIRLVPSPPTKFAGDFLHHLCGGEPARAEARKPPPPNQGPCLWRNSFVGPCGSRTKSQSGAGHAMNRGNCRVVFEAPYLKMKEVSLDPDFNNRRQVWIDDDDVDTSARHAPKCGFGRLAEEKKEQGNNLYKQKKYSEALALYTSAIELCPTSASYYGNRAACYMMLGKYRQALEDSQQAVRLDSNFVKGHLREAKCHLALGDTNAASRSLDKVRELEPGNATLKMELETLRLVERYLRDGDNAYKKGDYRTVVFCLDQVLRHAVACTRAKVLKAECLSLLGRHQEAQDIASDIIQFDSMNADALYVRGRCLYYQDNVERAMTHFQQVLRLAPDHTKAKDIYRKAKLLKAKKEEGNAAFKEGRLADAYELYSNALEIDPQNVFTNAKLYFNRAIVCSKTNRLNQAVEDCTNAIKLDETYMKAYLKRAQCYMELEMYEEAVREYEKIYRKERTREHKKLLDNAKLELKKSKRKDYYKILGVSKAATDDEIKKAYRKRALIHHPDRHSSASEEIKREQEKKFKELSEAYNILSDPKKRSRYDNGYDLDDADGFADVDPHNIFQTFFGGSAFPGHNADAFGQGFQFPNGFTFQFG